MLVNKEEEEKRPRHGIRRDRSPISISNMGPPG